MAVKKKAEKSKHVQYSIDDIINRGGQVSTDTNRKSKQEIESDVRFTLRIPAQLIEKIDDDRSARVGSVSRNQWVLEAIYEKLK